MPFLTSLAESPDVSPSTTISNYGDFAFVVAEIQNPRLRLRAVLFKYQLRNGLPEVIVPRQIPQLRICTLDGFVPTQRFSMTSPIVVPNKNTRHYGDHPTDEQRGPSYTRHFWKHVGFPSIFPLPETAMLPGRFMLNAFPLSGQRTHPIVTFASPSKPRFEGLRLYVSWSAGSADRRFCGPRLLIRKHAHRSVF